MAKLLIIDDDPKICQFLKELSDGWGHRAASANSIKKGHDLALKSNFDLILLDLELPDGNGLEILPDLLRCDSHPEVIIITGTGDIQGAKLAFKYGAWDYVQKPFTMEEVWLPITRALEYRDEKKHVNPPVSLNRKGIIGSSNAILSCLDDVARASVSDASVLITGETGTGKELFARAIHQNSKRESAKFIAIDCGAIPESLAEGTFFGHEKGAFTGADMGREGIIRQADGGTLFLDEIGDLALNIQRSLLRALQEKRIRPLGGNKEIAVDFRLVAATNRGLQKMVDERCFREDLLFRVRAIEINLPPLRSREKDIQEITIHKIHEMCQHYGTGTKGVSPELMDLLGAHNWPGNVRELINVMEYALASAGEDPTLYPKHLPPEYRTILLNIGSGLVSQEIAPLHNMPVSEDEFPTLFDYRAEAEKNYLKKIVKRARGDRERAGRLSGISQARLYGLLKKYNLSLTKS